MRTDIMNCQMLINSGAAWTLEGHVGRTCMAAIEDGQCLLGTVQHSDYYGNIVPSRTDVQDGTKGSPRFVVEHTSMAHYDELLMVPEEPTQSMMVDALIGGE